MLVLMGGTHVDSRDVLVAGDDIDVRQAGVVGEVALGLCEHLIIRRRDVLVRDGHHRLACAAAVVMHTVGRANVIASMRHMARVA